MHEPRLFEPRTCAVAITARRDHWGYWTLSITQGTDTAEGVEWAPSDTYAELNRPEVADVVMLAMEAFSTSDFNLG